MEYPSEEYNSFIVLPHTFSAIRAFDDEEIGTHLTATAITVKFSCTPINESDDGGEKAAIGYRRLRTWLEAVMENIIIIDVASPMLPVLFEKVSNLMMMTPGRTDDALLAELLHSKASAITNGLLDIHTLWLASSDTEFSERYYRNIDGNYSLPGIEYYDKRLYNEGVESSNKQPWWERPTVDICEYGQEEGENVVWFEIDPLLDIGKEYLTKEKDTEAEIVIFDAWKKKDK